MRKLMSLVLLLSLMVAVPAFAQDAMPTETESEDSAAVTTETQTESEDSAAVATGPTVAQIVNDNFVRLAEAVETAGMAELLASGEYTLFAPTDGAFRTALTNLDISYDDLLANEALLEGILNYHIVPGTLTTEMIRGDNPDVATATAYGPAFSFGFDDTTSRVTINNGAASIEAADIMASNGVVHVIDNVLLPPNYESLLTGPEDTTPQEELPMSVLDVVENNFVYLTAAIEAAGLEDELASGEYTLFAPTDGAFLTLATEMGTSRENLLLDEGLLTQVLNYHIVPGIVTEMDLRNHTINTNADMTTLPSFGYDQAVSRVTIDGGRASVAHPDIYANNGIVHIIDNVLLPPQ